LYELETAIMKNDNSESKISLAENDFIEFMQRGDDFYKIELLRQAKVWYNKALSLNVENDRAKSLISECDRLLSYESKVVYIVISVSTALLFLYFIFV
jgi:hypothetical protein